MIAFLKMLWSPFDRGPYPPWDHRAGPEVVVHWLTTGKDIRNQGNTP